MKSCGLCRDQEGADYRSISKRRQEISAEGVGFGKLDEKIREAGDGRQSIRSTNLRSKKMQTTRKQYVLTALFLIGAQTLVNVAKLAF